MSSSGPPHGGARTSNPGGPTGSAANQPRPMGHDSNPGQQPALLPPVIGTASGPASQQPNSGDNKPGARPGGAQQDTQLYGMALELAQNAGSLNPLAIRPAADPAPMSGSERRQAALARRANMPSVPQPKAAPQGRKPTEDDRVLQPLPASLPAFPGQEPDYGFVAELRQPDQAMAAPGQHSFGLAAEVARRRARPDMVPIGQDATARPRRRLAATGAPADFGLSEELAKRAAEAAERNRLDPFNSANRASNADPFQAADGLIKFPTAPYQLPPPQDQEVPLGEVPLRVPPSGLSQTSAVSKDDGEYGLAEELGVDPDEARRRRDMLRRSLVPHQGPLLGYDDQGMPIMNPAAALGLMEPDVPLKYTYDETTGMLLPPEGVEGDGGKDHREYMEDVATGVFYRINHEGLLRRVMLKWRRRQPVDSEELQEGQEGWDPDAGTLRGKLRSAMFGLSATFSLLGLFVQGLLGGMMLINLFMTYILYSSHGLRDWLQYYSAISLAVSRLNFTLITMAIVASAARFARDQLRDFTPRSGNLLVVDTLQLLLYSAAYITTILCTPMDDELQYEHGRNANFHKLTFSSGFKKRLSTWHVLNIIRMVCAGLGWLLCTYQNSPFVQGAVVRHHVNQELLRRLKAPRMSPVMIMADTPSPPDQHGPRPRGTHQEPDSPTIIKSCGPYDKDQGSQSGIGKYGVPKSALRKSAGLDTVTDQVGLPAARSSGGLH